jgi:hypothetical protein
MRPRIDVTRFRDIPNVGPAIEQAFLDLGLNEPADLQGRDPYCMYEDLCAIRNGRQDPCILDVFIAAVDYMQGGPVRKWWEFTEQRKRQLAGTSGDRVK